MVFPRQRAPILEARAQAERSLKHYASLTARVRQALMQREPDIQKAVSAAALTPPLTVRSWRPGDVFRPLGLGGRKKLQDLFVDRKIAQAERASIPIVADAQRGIVWVVGQAVAEDFRVTDPTAGVLILKARKLGDLG